MNMANAELYLTAVVFVVTIGMIIHTVRYFKGKRRLLKHMKRFAKEGDGDAGLFVADEYRKGDVVKKNCDGARFWYHKAALDGNEEAKKRLSSFDDKSKKRC
jgi:TPR repeat protein